MWNLVLVALGALVPAYSHAASAVVHDPDSGAFGYSFNQPSVSLAARDAVGHCVRRSLNCSQLATTSEPGYSALVTGSRSIGYALSQPNDEQARDKAMAMCRRRSDNCVLHLVWHEVPGESTRIPPAPPAPTVTLP
ncbi:DUF4189 domain-containing protein [Pseudoxanthomonas suwonensis]|uniref:DUF4189 domain-containing protein n=1 Tax=Pseudoxanthomonas suwonensis TaxID=314722 RepID=A0A0E3Z3W4_9GAMM|nr:DUF4189 domain-containing protein [Pseudoxanthomonas suwonensis]AKC87768.1 hypothetical protein WQ53_14370 [Pseudoxanthomonas suwonensis]